MKAKNQITKAVVLSLFMLVLAFLPTSGKAQQPPLMCPYTVTNYLPYAVCFNYELRGPSFPCPPFTCCSTLCFGTACIPASTGTPVVWTLPPDQAMCCKQAYDIVITVTSVGGCAISPTQPCAGQCGGMPTVGGPVSCTGTSYNVQWGPGNTIIN